VQNLFPGGLSKPQGSAAGLATFLGQGLSLPTAIRNKPNAYNQRWISSVQRSFRDTYKLEARYVGNHTVKMPINQNINSLPSQYLSRSPERDQNTINSLTNYLRIHFVACPEWEVV
jgi:hypothetical protein